jgi:hypothetical protein
MNKSNHKPGSSVQSRRQQDPGGNWIFTMEPVLPLTLQGGKDIYIGRESHNGSPDQCARITAMA